MSKCSNCGVEIGFLNRPTFGQGKQKDGTEICLRCFTKQAKEKNKPFTNLINGITEEKTNVEPIKNNEVVDLELNTIQKLQFKKFISEQSGMNLQDVDNYLETISEIEKEELIKTFKKENTKTKEVPTTQTHIIKEENNKPSCPKCKSKQVYADKKGFSGQKACCGALLAGPFGLLCGTHKSNKVRLTCLNCKHTW